MVVLKVLDYFDKRAKKPSKMVMMEKDGQGYDASGLFFKLDKLDMDNLKTSRVLFKEEVGYNDNSVTDKDKLIKEVLKLKKEYGVQVFNDSYSTLSYWSYMNGVTSRCN